MGQLSVKSNIYEGIFLYMIWIAVGLKILARTPIPKLPTKKIMFSKQKQR